MLAGETLANRLFQSFGKENVGEFKLLTFSQLSRSGIWLGKIWANDVCFARFAKVSPTNILCYMVEAILKIMLILLKIVSNIVFDFSHAYWLNY